VIAGRRELIKRMRSNPLFRALRVDKLTYAALEATLLAYVREDYTEIPILRMIFTPPPEIRRRAQGFIESLGQLPGVKVEIVEGESVIGGGAAPTAKLSTFLIAISSQNHTAEELQTRLRAQSPPVIARIEDDRITLDLRTVYPQHEKDLLLALEGALA